MNCDESDLLGLSVDLLCIESVLYNIVHRVLNFAERDGGGGVDDDCECILVHIRTIRGGIFWRVPLIRADHQQSLFVIFSILFMKSNENKYGVNIHSIFNTSDLNFTVRKGYSDNFCRGEMGKNWLGEG